MSNCGKATLIFVAEAPLCRIGKGVLFWATFCQKVGCYGVDSGGVARSAIDPVCHFIEDEVVGFKGS